MWKARDINEEYLEKVFMSPEAGGWSRTYVHFLRQKLMENAYESVV